MFSHGFMSFAAIGVTVACLVIMGTFTLVATKCDKLGTKALAESIASLERFGIPVVAFSSLKGTGRDELWNHILTAVSQ